MVPCSCLPHLSLVVVGAQRVRSTRRGSSLSVREFINRGCMPDVINRSSSRRLRTVGRIAATVARVGIARCGSSFSVPEFTNFESNVEFK